MDQKHTKLSSIMTEAPLTVNAGDPLKTVKDIFEKNHLRHIPVVEENQLKGIVSLLDFMRISLGESSVANPESINEFIYEDVQVGEVMIENPATLTPENTVEEAAKLFEMDIFHSIPIVENGNLVGIVTTTDVIRHMLNN